jgi:diguanylate cyclase (GGDEF)-like protein
MTRSRFSTFFEGYTQRLLNQPPWSARAIVLIGLSLVALVDFGTPAYFTVGPLYLSLAAYAAWTLGRNEGLIAGIVGTSVSTATSHLYLNLAVVSQPARAFAWSWGVSTRLLSILLVVLLVRSFRASYERERHLTQIDPLTGIQNRRAFTAFLGARTTSTVQSQTAMLACLDLDGFKAVNDRFGHAEGDAILRMFAVALSSCVRATDFIARTGGDEFQLYLEVPDAAAGQRIARDIHGRLRKFLEETPYELSCSMGSLVVGPEHQGISTIALVAAADRLMYEAKAAGGDQVKVAYGSEVTERCTPTTGAAHSTIIRLEVA